MNIKINKIIVFIFFIFFSITICNLSYAATSFKIFNNAPRMQIITNKSKYDDVKIVFTDYSGLDEKNIIFYSTSNGKKGEKIDNNSFIKSITPTYDKTDKNKVVKYTYIIKNKYLNKKTKTFYLEVIDKYNSDCYLKTFFRIYVRNKRYNADYPPRIKNFSLDENNLKFVVRDLAGVKSLKLYDMNSDNSSKEIYKNSKTYKKGDTTVSINLNKFTIKNDRYKIKIISMDNGTAKIKGTRIICFKVDTSSNTDTSLNNTNQIVEKTILSGNGIELDRKNILLDIKHYNFADLQVSLDYDKLLKEGESKESIKLKWESSNTDIATVNNNGRVKAQKKKDNKGNLISQGTALITVTVVDKNGNPVLINNKKAQATCNIKVMASGNEKTGLKGEKKYSTPQGHDCYVIKKLYYSPEEIESYITNAEMLLQKYPNKFDEAKETTINTFRQKEKYRNFYFGKNSDSSYYRNGNHNYPKEYFFDHKIIKKKEGRIDANGYLMIFTSKTQHLYLLKKQSGKWKVIYDDNVSGGYDFGGNGQRISYYTTVYRYENIGPTVTWKKWNESKPNIRSNALHASTVGISSRQPTSMGCIHLGSRNGKTFKTIINVPLATKLICY